MDSKKREAHARLMASLPVRTHLREEYRRAFEANFKSAQNTARREKYGARQR